MRTSGGTLTEFFTPGFTGGSDIQRRLRCDPRSRGHAYITTNPTLKSRIRRLDRETSIITGVLGVDVGATGPFSLATLANPMEVGILGDTLFVAAGNVGQVRRVDFSAKNGRRDRRLSQWTRSHRDA